MVGQLRLIVEAYPVLLVHTRPGDDAPVLGGGGGPVDGGQAEVR